MRTQTNYFAMLSLDDPDEGASSSDHQIDNTSAPDTAQVDSTAAEDAAQDDDGVFDGKPQLSPEEMAARAAATRFKQMAAFLLTFHDHFHGPEQPLEDGGIWGAVLHPRTRHVLPDADNELEPYVKTRCRITPVPGSRASYENPDNVWLTPPMPAKLGFPVKVTQWPFPEGWERDHNLYNYFVHSLFIGADPQEPSFGRFTHEGFVGDALIVRTDGKDLTDQQVEVLLHFMNDEIGTAALEVDDEMEEGKEKVEARKKLAEKYLCPEALHAYFEEFRRDRIAHGRNWKAKSPVAVTLGEVKPACGRCYARKPAGDEFLVCEGCGNRFYCSEECLEKDEKFHNLICMKEEHDSVIDSDSALSEEDLSVSDLGKSDAGKSE